MAQNKIYQITGNNRAKVGNRAQKNYILRSWKPKSKSCEKKIMIENIERTNVPQHKIKLKWERNFK